MFTQSLYLSAETIDKLFAEGDCLTFDFTDSKDYYEYIFNNHLVKKGMWIESKIAKLFSAHIIHRFTFSNGVLIHALDPDKDNSSRLNLIKKIIESQNLKISAVYGPQKPLDCIAYSEFLRAISERAYEKYPAKQHIYTKRIPALNEFISECFKNNNILLTASKYHNFNESKYRNLHESYRTCLALFENGLLFVSDRAGSDISNPKTLTKFKNVKNDYFYLQHQYIPQEYLDALYKEA